MIMASDKCLAFVRRLRRHFGSDTYQKFKLVLEQFEMRFIPSSYAVFTINKLFQNHPDLLLDFEAFVPANYSSAGAAAAADQVDSVDFLNKVATRFSGNNGVYRRFLDLIASYSNGGYTVSQVRNKVVRLFAKHHDLAEEFVSFLPDSEDEINNTGAEVIRVPETRKRKRREDGGGDKATGPSQKRVKAEAYFELEDSLSDVEIHLSNMRSTYKQAKKLLRRVVKGRLTPGDVRLDEHFTALTLACIRRVCRENRVREENILCKMPKLLKAMKKKKKTLKESRKSLRSDMKEYLLRHHH